MALSGELFVIADTLEPAPSDKQGGNRSAGGIQGKHGPKAQIQDDRTQEHADHRNGDTYAQYSAQDILHAFDPLFPLFRAYWLLNRY